ncbi:uncharacterized protein [Littorina saxatilis]|uniref:Autophagy-related protein 27 n=1 Tax=Littorina saxatilis TaxID=31220 RepID=A0AAN9BR87_9CAEN
MDCRRNIAVVTYWIFWVISLRVTSCDERSEVSSGHTAVDLFDGCKWSTLGGGVIDLSSIGNTDSNPRFLDVQGNDEFLYSYNPCYPFNEGTCAQAAVCQTTQAKDLYYQAGDATGAELTTDDQGRPSIHYSAQTEITRNSYVALICDEAATEPSLKALGDLSYADYHFELTTACACPNGCAGGGGGDVTVELSVSIGSIMCISLLAVLVVYLITGVVYNKARHKSSGSELCPNLAFWTSLPGLVKDGFAFSGSKLCRRKREGYEKI